MRLLAACLVCASILGAVGVPAGADEPSREELAGLARRAALEGSWEAAVQRYGAWSPSGVDRFDARGIEIELWRPTWATQADGRLDGSQAESASSWARAAAERLLAPTQDLARERAEAEPFGTTLLLTYERAWREAHGMARGPAESPLKLAPDPDGTLARFLAWQRDVYDPTPAEQSADAAWAAKARAARELGESSQARARRSAVLAAALLLTLTLIVGLGLGRRPSA